MKKTVVSFVFSLTVFVPSLYAQSWFDVGLKAGYNSTWMINKNILEDESVSYIPSYGYAAGGKAGFNFNEHVELTLDFLYSTFEQKFSDNMSDGDWKKQNRLTFIDLPFLFRYNKDGSYSEIGIQYSLLKSAKETMVSSSSSSGYSFPDVRKNFISSVTAVTFGVGSFIAGTENTTYMLGFRFSYGIQDIITKSGGKGADYPFTVYPGYSGTPKPYKPTNILYGGIVLEFNYDLGYLVSSKCKKKKEFLLF